ncbi:MAG: UvrD-helicase domain-containing protein [Clostridiales bacterium]|nr:UvrD-helicase domain-containing protein [Clostridiales bacterium]
MAAYDMLNPMQQEAVFYTEGPLLVLAGAGSGKTRVLTHRVAYLIEEKQVKPWNILAITFTNKAAGEMRERVDRLVEADAASVWVSTFHSACVRILRRFIDRLGYENSFSIYDADDQKVLMKQVLKRLDVDPKQFRERAVLAAVSKAKNELISPQEFMRQAEGDYHERKIAEAYQIYQEELKRNNALDFDDLLFKTVDLLQCDKDVLEYYQERFHYIMVDEYQDTNTAQFRLVSLLAGKYRNLCVVGDDDQSIYKFRGANVGNILDFEGAFPGAKVIRLEQNYRSTGHILDVANAVIRNNVGRKGKTLWTEKGEGLPVVFRHYDHAYAEAEGITRDILADGRDYKDYAILYRTNAQSRLLEEKCVTHNIPYRLVGGVNFYARKEIKDILAYLKTIANGWDDMAAQRIINVPKRGIGAASITRVTTWATEQDISFYEACRRVGEIPGIGKAAGKIGAFVAQIEHFRKAVEGKADGEESDQGCSVNRLIEAILEDTGYRSDLANEGEIEALSRLENINELINKAVAFGDVHEETGLAALRLFLEEVALVADVDSVDESENRVTLMTLHSAKGLEFPVVYLSGMEDGLFPGSMAIFSDNREDMEEERRLCYVGITRARERLVLTAARSRMIKGETRYAKISRFIDEIPEEMLERDHGKQGREERQPRERNAADPMMWKQRQKDLGIGKFGVKSNSYASPTASFGTGMATGASSPGFGRPFAVEKSSALDYQVGDRVCHIKFGEGVVQNIQNGPKDFEVTVCFDRVGVKRMFASFARLKKL